MNLEANYRFVRHSGLHVTAEGVLPAVRGGCSDRQANPITDVNMTPRSVSSFVLAIVIAAAGCTTTVPSPDLSRPLAFALPTVVHVRTAGRIVEVPLEEYVVGTALSEVSPVGESPDVAAQIFRLQAIIARTYALAKQGRHAREGFDLCDTTHCQLYEPGRLETSRFSTIARQATLDTAGQVLVFGQRPVEALFHSDCGGHTADAASIWGGHVPYLIGAPDSVPGQTHRQWQFTRSREELRQAFNAQALTRIGSRLAALRIVERDSGGRAARVEIKGDVVHVLRGEQVRSVLNQTFGPRAILSTRFSLSREADTYRFTGTGFGHGVGLCQVGAAARLRRGDAVRTVLSTYFPGTHVAGLPSRTSGS